MYANEVGQSELWLAATRRDPLVIVFLQSLVIFLTLVMTGAALGASQAPVGAAAAGRGGADRVEPGRNFWA